MRNSLATVQLHRAHNSCLTAKAFHVMELLFIDPPVKAAKQSDFLPRNERDKFNKISFSIDCAYPVHSAYIKASALISLYTRSHVTKMRQIYASIFFAF